MVSTIKFSEFNDGGDLANDDITVGYGGGTNLYWNNPWTFLPPGATGDRPVPTADIYYRLRLNTTLQTYEYYDPVPAIWVPLSGSGTGTVNPGTTYDLAYYPFNGTTLSPIDSAANSVLVTNGSMVPSLSTTLPTGLSIPGATITSSTASLTSGQVAAAPSAGTDITNKTYVDSLFGSGVTSITGTTNQVIASSPTGAVTLSLPQDIATGSNVTFGSVKFSSNIGLLDSNGNVLLALAPAASAVNNVTIVNASTGNTPRLEVTGSDANINFILSSKGTGAMIFASTSPTLPVVFNTGTANQHVSNFIFANTAATRNIAWPDASGTVVFNSTGTAVDSITGTANQVLANGTSGSAQTGAVTLTLPQDIATTSSPTFTAVTAGNINIAGSTVSSVSVNSNISITPNGTAQVLLGSSTSIQTSSGAIFYSQLARNSSSTGIVLSSNRDTANDAARINFYKSRNTTVGAHTTVQNGDILCYITVSASNGATWLPAGSIEYVVDGALGVAWCPSKLNLYTNTSTGKVLGLSIDSAQIVTLANPLPVGSGGIGITTTPSNGQIPIGNGTTYTAATLTAGAGVSITNGSGSITIAATGGGLAIATIAGTTQSAAVNTKYFALNASQTTVTLPSTYAVGDIVALVGSTANTGGWIVATAAGDTIRVNNATTSAGGTVTSAALAGQTIYLECDVANTSWVMTSTVSTTLTTS